MNDRLDRAYAALQAGGDAEGMDFYRALADAELFLVLEDEPDGDTLTPRVFDLAEGPVLLAFDSEDRLAAFTAVPQPYAALPGRVIAAQMAGQGVSLGLNLGSGAASETILPPEAMEWLQTMLNQAAPVTLEARIETVLAPTVPAGVLAALPSALVGVERAYLAGVRYADRRRGHLLALIGVAAELEGRTTRAVTEALVFSGVEAGELDVIFLSRQDPVLGRLARLALVFEGEVAPQEAQSARPGPGMDPEKPPVLR